MFRQVFLLGLLVISQHQLLTTVSGSFNKFFNNTFDPFYVLRKKHYVQYANPHTDQPTKSPELRASRRLQGDACGPGVRVMAFWDTTQPGFNYTVPTYGFLCYCPYDFYGVGCENHIAPLCKTKFTSIQDPPFPSMIGQIQLDCTDYTGYMAFQGIKPSPQNGKIPPNIYRIAWTNDSLSYDAYGNLIRPWDKNVTIDFSYSQKSSKFFFTNSFFYVQTKLISWVNAVQTISICTQPINAQNLAGLPFTFNCSFDHQKYKQYQPYGVYSLQSSVIENQNNGETYHQTSLRSFRWNIYNPNYKPKGDWKIIKTYPIWTKLLGLTITIVVLTIVWRQIREWRKEKSTMHQLRQNAH